MKCVATAVPGNILTRKGILQHADLWRAWDTAGYPTALHAPLLDLLHTFEVAFPLRNTRGEALGASVIVPMLGSKEDALQGRDMDGERESAVRNDGAAQLFVRYSARAKEVEQEAEEEKEEEGAVAPPSAPSQPPPPPMPTRFPVDFVGRLLARLHRFATRDPGGDGSSCSGAWRETQTQPGAGSDCILGYADNTALVQVRTLDDGGGDVLELDVWGVFPLTLRNLVDGAARSLIEDYYPGIALGVSVPCPCGLRNCVQFEATVLHAELDRKLAADKCPKCPLSDKCPKCKNSPADKCPVCKREHKIRVLLPEDHRQRTYKAIQRLEEYTAPPDVDGHALTGLEGSNFEREYSDLRGPPELRDELLWALRRVVKGYCAWHGKSDDECAGHLKLLHGEWKLADSVALAAQRLWTSLQKVDEHGVKPKTKGIEFCSLWSEVIRRDQASLARPSAMIARALNRQLVGAPSIDRGVVEGAADFPPGMDSRHPLFHADLKFCTWRARQFTGVVGDPAGVFHAEQDVPCQPVPGDVVQLEQGRLFRGQGAPSRRGQGAGQVAGGAGPTRGVK